MKDDEKDPAPPSTPPADGITAGFVVALVLLVGVLSLGGYWYVHRTRPPLSPLLDLGSAAVTTPSGLRFRDFQEGSGPSPQPGQTAVVHYVGRLLDGSTFDSSRQRGDAPFRFKLGKGEVIKGWDEGVASMKVGGVRRLVVPPDLGYGPRGSPPKIPAEATLVFDIELKGIE